jgi:hypothetical protein
MIVSTSTTQGIGGFIFNFSKIGHDGGHTTLFAPFHRQAVVPTLGAVWCLPCQPGKSNQVEALSEAMAGLSRKN